MQKYKSIKKGDIMRHFMNSVTNLEGQVLLYHIIFI